MNNAHKQTIQEYVFREYPKMLTIEGKQIIVDGAEAEAQAWEDAGLAAPSTESVEDLADEIARLKAMLAAQGAPVDERSALVAQAESLGIVVDKKWSTARIKTAIENAS